MSILLKQLNPAIQAIRPYEPGRPIEDVAAEYGHALADVCKLASNESALGPSPMALTALTEALPECHLYPDGGAWHLRQRLASHLEVGPEQLVIGNGSNEILELIGHCFMTPGSSIVCSAHAFAVYKLLAQLFGIRAVEVPATPSYGHDLAAMAKAIRDDTTVVFVCNPNNPTGTIVEPDELESFCRAVPERVLVVLDEAYFELALAAMPDALGLVAERPNVIVCRTFSKAYGLAGLRIGYGITSAALAKALNGARQPFNANRLAQIAGAAALDDVDFIARSRALCQAEKTYMEACCDERHITYVPGFANFMLIHVGDGAAVTNELLERGIIVRPMGGYQLPAYIRVTYGQHDDNRAFMGALGDVVLQ